MGPQGTEYVENEIAKSHGTDLDAASQRKSSERPPSLCYASGESFVAEIILKGKRETTQSLELNSCRNCTCQPGVELFQRQFALHAVTLLAVSDLSIESRQQIKRNIGRLKVP